MTEISMPRNTHVMLRKATYGFRMRVPADLVGHYGKTEITFSLKTKNLAEANRMAHVEALKYLHEFESIRKGNAMGPEEIRGVAQEFLYDLLSEDEGQRKSGFVSEGHHEAMDVLEDHARPTLAGDGNHDAGESRKWMSTLTRNQIDMRDLKVPQGSDVENELIYAFAQASVEAVDAFKERNKGKVAATPDRLVSRSLVLPVPPTGAVAVLLSNVIEEYSREQEKAGNWQEKTSDENRAIYRMLLEIIGDVPASLIGFAHMREFRSGLERLPANINKGQRYRGKSIAEILALPDVVPMSTTTINKYINRISSLLQWAHRHGYVEKNYASGLSVKQKGKKASDARRMFEANHIEAIFKAIAERRVTKRGNTFSFHYWAPLLGYTTGARINEIASLRVTDFMREDGIDFISITQQNDGEKGTKTEAGQRRLPIHPALIRLGILRYVETLRLMGEIMLFPELSQTKNGFGGKVTHWFSGHNSKADSFLWRDAGIREDKLSFHSYRHTMTTLLERQGIDGVLMKRILGHSLEDDVTFGRYSKGASLRQMLGALIETISEKPLECMPEFERWTMGEASIAA